MKYPAYPKYKDSGVEWLGEVPEHWEVKRLKHYIQHLNSGASVNSDNMPTEDDFPGILKTSCVYGDVFRPKENKRVVEEEVNRVFCPVVGDSLVISRMNTPELVGSCGYVAQDWTNLYLPDRLWITVFTDKRRASPKFFWYRIISRDIKEQISSLATGTSGSMKNLMQESFLSIAVAIPSLFEQRAIATFLDTQTSKLDTLIAKERELIDKLKEKRVALITRTVTRGLPPDAAKAAGLNPHPKMKDSGVEWLGEVPEHWEVKPLGYLVRMLGGGTPDKSNAEFWDGDIPWVSPKDMKKSYISDAEDHITTEAIQSSPASLLPLDSVLIVVRGMILLHSFPVALTKSPVTINQDMKALVCSSTILPSYLFYIASGFTKIFVSFADESAHGTRKLETDVIRHFPTTTPPIHEQRAIAAYLDRETAAIDALVAKVETAIERLQEYRATLITAAVTGQIDVREAVQ